MHIAKQLMAIPGVIAAGEYAYRGDRYTYEGNLTDEFARMAAILCRANTLNTSMQAEIFSSFSEHCGCRPLQGWVVRGRQVSDCAVGNFFCLLENRQGVMNDVMTVMRAKVGDIHDGVMKAMYSKIGGDTTEQLV